MKTAVDSSVLLDVFVGKEPYLEASQQALRSAIARGSLIVGEVVWAEVRAHFQKEDDFLDAMDTLGVSYQPTSAEAASQAGRAWGQYRKQGGKRQQLIPDFIVAAHALIHAEILLTRDRGFSKRYFRKLKVWDPTKLPAPTP